MKRDKEQRNECTKDKSSRTSGCDLYYADLGDNIALTLTQASNISVIVSIAPIFTGILAHFFLEGEKMKKSIVLGFVCAMAGICLITFQKGETVELNPLGDFLGVAAAAIWGVYSICSRKIAGFGYDTIITTRRTFFYGILFMLCALPFMDFHLSLSALLKPVNLGNIIYLGVGASAICFVTWNYAVKSLGATRASVYIYGIPVVTILMSIPLLHEVITFQAMAGTVLTLVGLLISEWPFSPKK